MRPTCLHLFIFSRKLKNKKNRGEIRKKEEEEK